MVEKVFGERLKALRGEIASRDLGGFLVPRYDRHQGEYIAPHDERLKFLTGFTGSAGFALVLPERALMFVDGRYQVQVRQQVDLADYGIEHSERVPVEDWLKANAPAGLKLGVNAELIPIDLYDRLGAALGSRGGTLVAVDGDPVDAIWAGQPAAPLAAIAAFGIEHAGEASAEKRRRIGAEIAAAGATVLVEAQPDNIAWLLNVRGADVVNNPFPHSFLLLDRDGGAEWFVDRRKLPNNLESYELGGVELSAPDALWPRLAERVRGRVAWVDPEFAPAQATLAAETAGAKVVRRPSPITLAKAFKNEVERAGFRSAHLEDGAAWTNLIGWLKANVARREAAGDPIMELEVEDKALEFRKRGASFVYPSFRSISAATTNAAMCHYAATPQSNAPLRKSGLYLLDSGGQYPGGTTDGTRTLAFGPVPGEISTAYTAVLKCFIGLITLTFPVGTFGHQIDAFARRPLWDLGLDYDHGAGHGIGHFLSVHENPHRFEQKANPWPLKPGLVMTIEPGLYLEGRFGMRIENQVELVDAGGGFVRFESLTLAPIDLTPVDASMLTEAEISFVDSYHAEVREKLAGRIDPAYADYLNAATEPLATQLAAARQAA